MSEEIKNEEVVEETQDTSTTDNAVEEITETPVENNETPTEETEVSNEEENTDVAEETPVEEETTTEVSDEEDSEDESGISKNDEPEDEVTVPAISKGTIARTILLAIGLINLVLTATGNSPLPFDSEDVNMAVSVIFDIIVSIVAWWKDNDFTVKARLLKANK